MVFNENAVLKPQLFCDKITDQENSRDTVIRAAKAIRNEIISQPKPFIQWPRIKEELIDGSINLPELVTTFLSNVLRSNRKTSKRTERIVKSLGQDLIYNCTNGKIRTKKHMQLGILVKRKTGEL